MTDQRPFDPASASTDARAPGGRTVSGIAFDDEGSGEPIALVHAGVADRRMWSHLAAGLATDHEARLADASCPWKGLAPYGDQDGDTFFGRDADIAACLARLRESPLLVVTGPSGSGKSSLVQAGLVPALRAGGADVEVFTPGAPVQGIVDFLREAVPA